MRQLTIVLAFLAGVLGLFMSLCGGGFFVMMAYQSVISIIQSAQQDQIFGALVLLTIPATFAVCGAGLFWVCFKYISRSKDRSGKTRP